jgi:ubiquinone biosynthesis protein Coq4
MTRAEAVELLKSDAPGSDADRYWRCPVGPITLVFPNFRWRRDAIRAHDLHHLMAGYPKGMRGEFQMAAWELGAGPYRHWGALLFCSPLLAMGMLWSPSRMARAYRAGRATTSLYAELSRPSG